MKLKAGIGVNDLVTRLLVIAAGLLLVANVSADEGRAVPVGVARIDITPEGPIRMAGYGDRRTESEGVAQRLWAKALAIGDDESGPAVLVTVENCGVPASVTEEVARKLENTRRIRRERLVVCSTHIHTGPCLTGVLATQFGQPLPKDQQATIERYTRELPDKLEKVAMAALADRQPRHLSWAQGTADFAVNRRVLKDGQFVKLGAYPAGPVDRVLPVLRVTDASDKVIAIVANYACHCTALGAAFNRICGDWAGYAQQYIEEQHPGAICMMTIGCAGDADPQPRTGLEYAQQHGRTFAAAVDRILRGDMTPIRGPLTCRLERIRLTFDRIPTRPEWESLAKGTGATAYHARLQLARLNGGEQLQKELDYPIQVWRFGDNLTFVFLAGEVMVDYSIRLRKELNDTRLWLCAYANDVPCYIPSRRNLAEGGYEVDTAMVYYDRPGRLAQDTEDRIVACVHRLALRGQDARPESRTARKQEQ